MSVLPKAQKPRPGRQGSRGRRCAEHRRVAVGLVDPQVPMLLGQSPGHRSPALEAGGGKSVLVGGAPLDGTLLRKSLRRPRAQLALGSLIILCAVRARELRRLPDGYRCSLSATSPSFNTTPAPQTRSRSSSLRDVEAGTTVNFTDNGWLAAGGFRAGEGTVTYTAAAAVTAGYDCHADRALTSMTPATRSSPIRAIPRPRRSSTSSTLRTATTPSPAMRPMTTPPPCRPASRSASTRSRSASTMRSTQDRPADRPPSCLAAVSNSANWINSDALATPFRILERPDIDLDADNSTHGGRDYRGIRHLGRAGRTDC